MCSWGSVIPLFIKQIKEGKDLIIINKDMTRFIMSLDESVDLVLYAFEHGNSWDLFVMKASACNIETLALAVKKVFNSNVNIKTIGILHGEKMYETLLRDEECKFGEDMGHFYRVTADNRDLNYDKYVNEDKVEDNFIKKFVSNNTKLLNVDEVVEKLLKLEYIKKELKG